VRLAHVAGEFRCLAEVVEQLALRAGARQRLEFVLAVDVDDQRADVAQQRERHGHAVEIAARAAVGGDHAAHGELVLGFDGLLLEQIAQSGGLSLMSKVADSSARSVPARTTSAPPLPPDSKASASTTMDFRRRFRR
jgi:hypothetical protein